MTISILDPDVWPRVERAIIEERARRMSDLLHVATLDGMRQQQGFIEALDWVMAEARPPPPPSPRPPAPEPRAWRQLFADATEEEDE